MAPSDRATPAPGRARHAFPGRPWLGERTDRARAGTASREPERAHQSAAQVAPSRQPDLAHSMGQLGLDPVVPSNAPNRAVLMEPLAPPIDAPAPARGKLSPLSPGRFALQATVDQETHDALCQAQELLGHSVPSGDLATVLKNAALAYVELLEKKKFAKCRRPQPQRG